MALRPRTQPSSPSSSLTSVTNHDDQPLWEDVPDVDNRRCVLLEVYGDTDCLSSDTHIAYQVRTKGGKLQNSKGGSIEHLYRRFNNLPRTEPRASQRPQTVNSLFYVSSVRDDGSLKINQIVNVLNSGIKPVFLVVTASGRSIKATLNHKFMVESGSFVELGSLREGDEVMVSPGVAKPRLKCARKYRPEVTVKQHPSAKIRIRGDRKRYRLSVANASLEAHRNGMTYHEYLSALNTAEESVVATFWSIPAGAEVHHLDENPTNNDPANLVLVPSRSEHIKEHHLESSIERLRIYVEADRIVSIEPLGEQQTYDLVCAEPYRNFVANGFAVHNSGRSTFALTAPGPIAYIHTYEKVGGLFQPVKKAGKEVRPCKVGGVMRGSTEEVMALASAAAARLEHAIADAYSWARSIILDTHTEMWQIIQLARLGSLSRDERKEKDIQKGQLVYAEINARWKSIMKHHRVQADLTNYTNLIIIGQTTEEYKKVPNSHSNAKQATGRTIAAGMKETGFLCDVRLRLKRSRESEFSAVIEKPWNAGHLRGFEVEGEQLNFADIMAMITETDASEWA